MRNLKKILALVLALVMSFSLMATANAFTDDEQITDTYETAVTVLDGLKVFQGYDDGSFQPQSPIRRSEVAAIIYRIVTGDVTDAQVGIYADYNKFDDVKSTSWYAGYVNFCANAEYIKGRDARTFDPDSYVTGYEALAMILRAIGYDKNGEFTGSSWQVQTAATGELRGITKNITAGTLGTYASREVVAEILFQTILVDKVNYTPAFGYQLDDTSLGWDTFELEDIEGVVIANEYADLYATKPLKAGETELNVDGDSYVLAYASELTDIGEARHAYITEGENVLYLADAGNTVFETGAATDIEKDKDFEKATGLERDDDTTEQFINFSQDGKWTCDYLLTYGYDEDELEDGTAAPHGERVIKAGNTIDIDELKAVFDDNNGYVYLGTKNTVDPEDYSNTMSWNKFRSEYLDNSFQDDVTESDNGEWLKVIDNDNDGVADYVLLTEFAMSVIERISKDDEYTLATLEREDAVRFDRNTVEIDGADIVTEDELAEDDVVIYTLIDGNYYMNIAEMVTETVDDDRNAINSKTETMTCDGTEYVQSHIGYGDGGIYYYDVTEAYEGDTYDLYLDYFGYVRLFVESDYDTFMLLTNGWFEDDRLNTTYQAMYWDIDAEEQTVIDVTDNGGDFIYDDSVVGTGDDETWGNLKGADVTYMGEDEDLRQDYYATNIAGYTETDDGYALKSVEDSAERMDYDVRPFDVDGLKDETLQALDGGNDIQTTSNTQYYLVIRDDDRTTVNGWSVEDVITWTGYKNAPDAAELGDGAVGYAVTHDTKTAGRTYDVADVVVFETYAYNDRDVYFVYAPNNWRNWVDNPSRYQNVWGIGYDYDDGETITSENRLPVEDEANGWPVIEDYGFIEFYKIYDDETVEFIGDPIGAGEYAANDIYAGWAETSWDIEDVDYIRASVVGADDLYISVDAPVYKVVYDAKDGFDVKELDRDKVDVSDFLILFTDGSDDDIVEYAINVDKSMWDADNDGKKNDIIADVMSLWRAIAADAAPDAPIDYEELLNDALAAADKALTANDLAALNAALDQLNDLLLYAGQYTPDQIKTLTDKIDEVEAAIKAIEAAGDAATVAANMIEKWNGNVAGDVTDADMFAAAAAYQPYYNKGLSEEADEAYDKAQGEADTLVAAVNTLDANEAQDVEDAFVGPNALVPVNADALAIADNTNDEVDNYNEKVEELEAAKEKYDLAVALVDAYDAWNKADNNGNPTVTANKLKELWDAAVAAYNAAVAAKVDKAFTDTDEKYFGSKDTSYDTAVNGVKTEIDAQPQVAEVELELSDYRDAWKVTFENGVMTVGDQYTHDSFNASNLCTYLVPTKDSVYDTYNSTVWKDTTPEGVTDYSLWTATIGGPNGGDPTKIVVRIVNADDADKVAHDKALLDEALKELDMDISKTGGEVTSDKVEARLAARINEIWTALTNDWGSTIEVTVEVDTPYDAPDKGDKVDYTAEATIVIASNDAEATLTLDIAGTVANTEAAS